MDIIFKTFKIRAAWFIYEQFMGELVNKQLEIGQVDELFITYTYHR